MSITIYTRPTCAPCHAVKKYLKSKGYEYKEIDVDADPESLRSVQAITGYQVVPLTMVDNEPVMGMNFGALNSLLTKHS